MNGESTRPQHKVASAEERKQLEEECAALRNKLCQIRKRRAYLHRLAKEELSDQLEKWLERQNESSHRRQLASDECFAAASRKNLATKWLDLAQKWNVTNDCFHIWHRGPFGTINGLRLGSEVPAVPSAATNSDVVSTKTNGSALANLGIGSSVEHPNGIHGKVHSNDAFKVSWVEINSAIGLLTLLLATLEQKPHCGIKFQNELRPIGSTSKIGIRKGESVTYYNLHSDDSFQLFGKRNFNIAMAGLLRCVADAAVAVEKRDRTIALPHAIETNARGEMTIGGLPILYGTDGEQWTRAMKYILTNTKWLCAFTAKHVDR